MKKPLLLLLLAALTAPAAQAQKLTAAQVPAAVVATFHKAHPAKAVHWEKEDGNYEAGFGQGKQEMSVLLNPSGTLLETETEMPVTSLPAPVRAALAAHYAGQKITEAAQIVSAAGVTTYEAEVRQNGHSHDVIFTAAGAEVGK